MEFGELLWQNWSSQEGGGIAPAAIADKLDAASKHKLDDWAAAAAVSLRGKELVDLASWCVFGTDALTLLPAGIRRQRLEGVAERYRIPVSSLTALVGSARSLCS
jgi:hypothetical protein